MVSVPPSQTSVATLSFKQTGKRLPGSTTMKLVCVCARSPELEDALERLPHKTVCAVLQQFTPSSITRTTPSRSYESLTCTQISIDDLLSITVADIPGAARFFSRHGHIMSREGTGQSLWLQVLAVENRLSG
jgi:hypothetical protein